MVVSISRSLYLESFFPEVIVSGVFLSNNTVVSMTEFAGFVFMVFGHYIGLFNCYFSVCIWMSQSAVASFPVTFAGSCLYHLSDTWML